MKYTHKMKKYLLYIIKLNYNLILIFILTINGF